DVLIVLRTDVQRQIDVLFKELGIEKTADVDVIFKRVFEQTTDLDTLFRMLDIERTVDLNTVFRGTLQKTVDLDAIFLRTFAKQAIIDIFLKAIITKSFAVDASFLRENIEIQRQVDVLFRRLDLLKSFGVDMTLIKENIVKGFAIDTWFGAFQTYELSRLSRLNVFDISNILNRMSISVVFSIPSLLNRTSVLKAFWNTLLKTASRSTVS
ncbi:unnamed protein product, partial [marine sediment metagenome]